MSNPFDGQSAPRLIVVTRVISDGDGNDEVLGPTDWRSIDHHDGTHSLVVAPELEARARELFPGALLRAFARITMHAAPAEKGGTN